MVATTDKAPVEYKYFKLDGQISYAPVPQRAGVTVYESESEMLAANPDWQAAVAEGALNIQRAEIDSGSGVSIEKKHAAKYAEAVLYLSGTLTDMTWLKHLADEHDRCGGTVAECAQAIYDKATEDAAKEKARVTAKAAL